MMLLRRPDDEQVQRFLRAQALLPFSYREVGATRGEPPSEGYAVDAYEVILGRGEACFRQACAALDAWRMYPASWCRVYPDEGSAPRQDLVFVTRIHHLGFWSLNSCRVLYLIDDEGDVAARGFAFGTLPGHEEEGEERFRVRWDRGTDEVRYDVLAFSRPRGLLARLGEPVARAFQRRFARETRLAMVQAARERPR